ncbi:hypothetical protein NQZ79_g8577 [Umbelopsis isabellina]|nr:hypothetical protein NQZ79_g8577 [Umbelopsis isabellina]
MYGTGLLGTFLMFCAWLLQLFTIIGGLNNLPFLNKVYYAQARNNNQATNYNLWNSCNEQPIGTVTQCGPTQPAYDWSTAAPYNNVSGLGGHSHMFLALSICTWIAFGLTTLILLSSLCTNCCCRKRAGSRWFDFNHFWWTLISWLAQLAALVLALLLGIRGGQLISNSVSGTSTSLGPSTWMSVGALAALTLAMLMYCCGFCCGGRKRRTADAPVNNYDDKPRRGWFGRKRAPAAGTGDYGANPDGYGANTGGYGAGAGAGNYGGNANAANGYNV